MTLEQIRAMSDRTLHNEIRKIVNVLGKTPVMSLDDAMGLVPQAKAGCKDSVRFMWALCNVLDVHHEHIGETLLTECPNKPRAICEAFLLWKGAAT